MNIFVPFWFSSVSGGPFFAPSQNCPDSNRAFVWPSQIWRISERALYAPFLNVPTSGEACLRPLQPGQYPTVHFVEVGTQSFWRAVGTSGWVEGAGGWAGEWAGWSHEHCDNTQSCSKSCLGKDLISSGWVEGMGSILWHNILIGALRNQTERQLLYSISVYPVSPQYLFHKNYSGVFHHK
jgi:hypothetical protein